MLMKLVYMAEPDASHLLDCLLLMMFSPASLLHTHDALYHCFAPISDTAAPMKRPHNCTPIPRLAISQVLVGVCSTKLPKQRLAMQLRALPILLARVLNAVHAVAGASDV